MWVRKVGMLERRVSSQVRNISNLTFPTVLVGREDTGHTTARNLKYKGFHKNLIGFDLDKKKL